MPRLSFPKAPSIDIVMDFNTEIEEEDILPSAEGDRRLPAFEFFNDLPEDHQEQQMNLDVRTSQTNLETGSSSMIYRQPFFIKGNGLPLRKDESVFEDPDTLLNFANYIFTSRDREKHATTPRLNAKFQKIHNHASVTSTNYPFFNLLRFKFSFSF